MVPVAEYLLRLPWYLARLRREGAAPGEPPLEPVDRSGPLLLSSAQQRMCVADRLAADATAIVNNHYDTDGTCALFAVRHPRAALEREEALLAAVRRAPIEDPIVLALPRGGLPVAAEIAATCPSIPAIRVYEMGPM